MAMGTATLLDPDFLGQLQRLRLVTRRPASGLQAGDRRSVRRGQSAEFADYRNYAPGDDFRRVDWSAYARLERLFLKLYVEEQEATLHVLVDASASMEWGTPSKFRLAVQMAAALGYVALSRYDRAAVGFGREGLIGYLGPLRGQPAVQRLWDHLGAAAPGGRGNLAAAVRDLAKRRPAPGVTVVISDCLMPLDFLDGLGLLQKARQEVALIQVLAPDELAPDLEGDLMLVDRESGERQEIAANQGVLAEYARRLTEHTTAIAQWCGGRAVPYIQVPSTLPLADLVVEALRKAGLVE